MSETWLETQEDMDWLEEVHGVPPGMKCAILTGNEDCPERIEAWRQHNPHYQTPPDYVFVREDAP